ncbi:hypothetical protein W02_12080 [Nitrospira sp. KM1]|nr:hypothetical protein W02_12080 [Nitrospira sp. KM1]
MASNPFHVQLELLAAVRTQRDLAFVVPRNIFSLTSTPSAALSDQQGEGDPLQAGAQADTELSQYQYLGFVRTGEEWDKTRDLAVVTRNEDLHLVRKGQVVESRIVVKQITPESITLQDRRSRQEHTVPLSEEELSDP